MTVKNREYKFNPRYDQNWQVGGQLRVTYRESEVVDALDKVKTFILDLQKKYVGLKVRPFVKSYDNVFCVSWYKENSPEEKKLIAEFVKKEKQRKNASELALAKVLAKKYKLIK